MPDYRRFRVPGGSYFFTVNLADRRSHLLTDHIAPLRAAFREVRDAHPFHVDAIVVLPDHLHCIWTLPVGDDDFSMRWRQIKSAFSRTIPAGESRSMSRRRHGERGIWQRRFWEHAIRDENDHAQHVDYIHWNPMKHKLTSRPIDWRHSSIHSYVQRGILPADWGTAGVVADLDVE